MLDDYESLFISTWENKRIDYKKSFSQYLKGISRGLALSSAILLMITLGWYHRANMVALSKLNVIVVFAFIVGLCVFMGWLYRNYHFEISEQKYKELKAKQSKSEISHT